MSHIMDSKVTQLHWVAVPQSSLQTLTITQHYNQQPIPHMRVASEPRHVY
jgi:hypothetical protein